MILEVRHAILEACCVTLEACRVTLEAYQKSYQEACHDEVPSARLDEMSTGHWSLEEFHDASSAALDAVGDASSLADDGDEVEEGDVTDVGEVVDEGKMDDVDEEDGGASPRAACHASEAWEKMRTAYNPLLLLLLPSA